jgi:hypothetical protein
MAPHMPPAAYIQLASADVARARANAKEAAAAYLAADAHVPDVEERFLGAASELRYVLHVHEQHVKQSRAFAQDPTKCSSCQQRLCIEDLDANWGRCAGCL